MSCLQPISIKNPNALDRQSKIYQGLPSKLRDLVRRTAYIQVPCGHCEGCIHTKQLYWVQRLDVEASRSHVYFITLTYDDDHLPFILTSEDWELQYVAPEHFQHMVKRWRNDHFIPEPFKYFAVTEYGGETHRPHIHLLLFLPKFDSDLFAKHFELDLGDYIWDTWSENYGTRKTPKYVHFSRSSLRPFFDCSFVDYDCKDNQATFYTCKYLIKYDDWTQKTLKRFCMYEDDLERSICLELFKPRHFISKGLGALDYDSIRSEIEWSLSAGNPFPQISSPTSSARSYPLCRYYQKLALTPDDKLAFMSIQNAKMADDLEDVKPDFTFSRDAHFKMQRKMFSKDKL